MRIKYIVDVYKKSAQTFAQKYQCTMTSMKEALSDDEINAIIICTTSKTHATIITAAAAAGKDIFCEKPLAMSVAETVECLNAVKKNNVLLYCG